MLYQIVLSGCQPEPLSSYLKALGVLRVLTESRSDAECKGYWEDERFVLITELKEAKIVEFFLRDYNPSPFLSPWNGSTGFYPKDAQKDLLETILAAPVERFDRYRQAVETSREVVNRLGLTEQPKDPHSKKRLLSQLRNTVPDTTAQWIDTCAMITNDADTPLKFVPLMGTGGNDGNFEFGRSFIQQLQNTIDFVTGEPTTDAEKLLRSALFDTIAPKLSYSGKIGQFSPIAAGGANSTTGTDGDSRVNPWDFILMLEGMLVLMPGITRRGESGQSGVAAPFTANRPSSAGYGSAADEKIRAELWIPLWDRPVGLGELTVFCREGRAKVNTSSGRGKLKYRTAQSGVDFVRAVSSLGVARGMREFHRYGFQERNGLSYFAVSLGRFQTPPRPRRDPLRELDDWLRKFANLASGDAPAAIKRVARQLEQKIVEQAQGKATFLDLLIVLGEVEQVLDRSLMNFTSDKIKPIPYLRSSRWVVEANDNTPEFRLALALAKSGLRQRLVRVRGSSPSWEKIDDKVTTWSLGSLTDNLLALSLRLEIEQEQAAKTLLIPVEDDHDNEEEANDSQKSEREAYKLIKIIDRTLDFLPNFSDIAAWINNELDDERLEAIARGLSLLKFTRELTEHPSEHLSAEKQVLLEQEELIDRVSARNTKEKDREDREINKSRESKCLPVAYQLLKLIQHRQVKQDLELPRVPGLIGKLQADRLRDALEAATRRLRASNLRPRLDPVDVENWLDRELDSARLGAALAFPLTDIQVAQILTQITIQEKEN